MTRFVRSASLLFSGVFAGFLVCVLVLENSLRGFDAAVYTQTRLVELDSLDKLASATLIPAMITTVLLAIRARGNDRRIVLVAIALLVVVFATTFAINLPINSHQSAWSVQNPPSDWASVRDRWQVAHLIRTVAAVLAFGVLITASQITATVRDRGRRMAMSGRG
ncbi:anthrone oxygenase family protein [Kribbella sp. CA-245084]|uniref:anthrone oxygenase family protein n=1 Tax=Kribbella sp. CA-245084 TaxID=3239940 RepID=UPI003D93F467